MNFNFNWQWQHLLTQGPLQHRSIKLVSMSTVHNWCRWPYHVTPRDGVTITGRHLAVNADNYLEAAVLMFLIIAGNVAELGTVISTRKEDGWGHQLATCLELREPEVCGGVKRVKQGGGGMSAVPRDRQIMLFHIFSQMMVKFGAFLLSLTLALPHFRRGGGSKAHTTCWLGE